jgi:hypothetical protein
LSSTVRPCTQLPEGLTEVGQASGSNEFFPAAAFIRQLPQALALYLSGPNRLVDCGELLFPLLEVAAHVANSTLHVENSLRRDEFALLDPNPEGGLDLAHPG